MIASESRASRDSKIRKRVLVIDDDVSVCDALQNVLEAAGHLVITAHDGQEGANRLRAESFDLLVLDLNLPVLSGWDVLDFVKAELPSLRVVILTGELHQCERGAFAGTDVILEKPCDAEILLKTMEKLLAVEPGAALDDAALLGKLPNGRPA